MTVHKLMKGAPIARVIYDRIKTRLALRKTLDSPNAHFVPKLGIIQVSHRFDSDLFVSTKAKRCQTLGFNHELVHLSDSTSPYIIAAFNADDSVNGIVLQLPLPPHLNTDFNRFLNHIDPLKDIDCLGEANYNRVSFFSDCRQLPIPCVVKSLDLFLQSHQIDCREKMVVILGRSYLVGCPTRTLFQLKGASVHLCDEYTPNVTFLLSLADIIVFGTGKHIQIGPKSLKEGCVVFDIGIRTQETPQGLRVTGDVDLDSVA